MALLSGYLFIFFARIVDVSLQTIRVLLLVRGKRIPAAAIGFFEVMLYITVNEWDCKAFVTVLDAKITKGGYFQSRKSK